MSAGRVKMTPAATDSPGRSRRLDDVVFEDRGLAERRQEGANRAQQADREHRDRNRGGNRQPRPQSHVHRDRAEDDAEDAPNRIARRVNSGRCSLAGT